MKKLLRGTYRLKKQPRLKAKMAKKNAACEFEAKVTEKLGGSIAFVCKPKLLWKGDDAQAD